MAILTSSWTWDILLATFALATIIISWIRNRFTFWEQIGIETPNYTFFFGHAKNIFLQTETFGQMHHRVYTYFKRNHMKHGGIYLLCLPLYVPVSVDIIKNIMQNDFQHFTDRGVYYNEEKDPLSATVFHLEGERWKNMRAKLTPTFTSGKIKMMFELIVECSKQLTIELDKYASISTSETAGEPMDAKDILARFTTDVIGTCAFGIECNTLRDPNSEFRKRGKAFFESNFMENITAMLTFTASDLMKSLGFPGGKPHVTNFFMKIITDTVQYREANNIQRNDFMQLLIQLKNDSEQKLEESNSKQKESKLLFSMKELSPQAFIFFVAGFETSSTTMTFCLYELASNMDIQQKVREEINTVLGKHDNKLTYEAVMEMTYMEKVLNETLRKHPPLPSLNRICTKDYPIPGTNTILRKGTKVMIPVIGLHYDEEFYPDPETFDPERFSEESKKTRPQYSFLPFGEGPRICIGLRFGVLQAKLGLTVLIKNYIFSLHPKTIVPLQMDPRCFFPSAKTGIWLSVTKVK